MNTMTKKFLPLGTLVLIMAFFLTGCDAVLETLYPDFSKDNGKFATKTLNLELSYDKALKGPIVVALVPYDDQNGYMVPADTSRWNIQRDTSKSGLFKVNLALDGFKTYRLIAFNNDPNEAQFDAADKPNKDQSQSMVISVGYSWDGKFTAGDVDSDKYFQYLGKYGKMDVGAYNELFPADTGSSGIWLTMPKDFNTNTTLDQFKLSRVYNYKGMSAISEIYVDVYYNNGYAATRIIPVGANDQFNIDIPFFANGNPYTFSTSGTYELDVYYKENGVYTTVPETFSFYIGAANGYAAGAPLELSVTITGWNYMGGATSGELYYLDDSGTYSYIGHVSNTDTGPITRNVPYLPGGYLWLSTDTAQVYSSSPSTVYGTTTTVPSLTGNLQGVPAGYDGYTTYSVTWNF